MRNLQKDEIGYYEVVNDGRLYVGKILEAYPNEKLSEEKMRS